MNIKGAIFDMDGTLIDSLGLWDVLWKEFGDRYCGGKTFVPDEVTDRYIRTVILPEAMRFLHERCGIGESAEEVFRVADDCFVNFYKTQVELKPGVRKFLDYCAANGVKMCIASAGEPHLIEAVFEHCDLGKYFSGVVSCASVGKGKESPDVFLAARELLGTKMDETWVFEDSVLSLDTLHKAGFHTVGIYDSHNHDPERVRALSEIYIAEGEGLDRLIGKEFWSTEGINVSKIEKRELHIEEIDSNFTVNSDLGRDDIRFFDVKKTPNYLFGLRFDTERFFRMDEDFAATLSDGVFSCNRCTSGGRIRFRTNSPFVAVSIQLSRHEVMHHMAPSGSAGFDLYVDGRFYHAYLPSASKMLEGYDRIVDFHDTEPCEREIMIHFPLYNRVDRIHVGVQENAWVTEAKPYAVERPVAFYGSSITQGGCVSRPGIAYPAYISRWLDFDYINLGFSGNAKGELSMAEYIASLDPSVLVMDYDHNAPSYEHLEATHYAFYERFRALRPDTPVVMVSAPDIRWNAKLPARRDLIRRNYEAAVAAGDDRVFFVDGETLMGGDDWDSCTVDGCHPNDLGHYLMAKGIAPTVKRALATCR